MRFPISTKKHVVASFLCRFTSKDQLPCVLTLERSLTDSHFPGKWGVVSGTVEAQDNSLISRAHKEMQEELVNQMHKADFDGTVSGITQTAQQTYLKQFAPQDTEEAAPPQSPQKTQKEKK
jgi:hypothetical protein